MTSAVEQLLAILDLEPLEVNLFRGRSPAGWLAARVRRPGDRPGAGRGEPHRRWPAAAFAARLFPAGRRSQGADHLRGRSHPRRQELHHPARGGDPARPGDLHHGGVVPRRRVRPRPSGADARRAAVRRRCRATPRSRSASCRNCRRRSGATTSANGRSSCGRSSSAATSARSRAMAASTSGSAPPAGCPTIRPSIAACWPTHRT